MQTLSSARRTCMASPSAVECTATVAMPSSLAARRMRSAISPRLAMRILSNMVALLDDEQRLAVLDRLPVLHEDRRHGAGPRRGDVVEGLHGLDEEELVASVHLGADLDEVLRLRRGLAVGGADLGGEP